MSRVPGRFGVKAVAAAYGVEPRELLALVRSGQLPAMGAGALPGEGKPKPKKLDLSAFIRSATEIST